MANADFRGASLGAIPKISRVTTSDETPTVGQEVEILEDGHYLLEVQVICMRKGGSAGTFGDGACYTRTLRAKKINGSLSIATAQTDFTEQDQRSWAVNFEASGEFVQAVVRGAAGNTVDWTIKSSLHTQL